MRTLGRWLTAVVVAGALSRSGEAAAQCMLANPSFEMPGSSGSTFAGWYQFGPVGSTTTASHGVTAAKVSGPNTGNWDVAGYWQNIVTKPGEQWTASVRVRNPSSRPLKGGSQALLNIEWRDAAGNLLSYESHAAATAATPTDSFFVYTITSAPAPANTASLHYLLGVLQGPTDATPDVYFDSAYLVSLGPPTHGSLQWSDFPGGKTLSFSGRSWRVKGPGYYGPGPSWFTDNANNAWVDASGHMHLTVKNVAGTWYSTEVTCVDALGYGDYIFTTHSDLDQLDQRVVLGLFLWEYGGCYDGSYLWWNPYNEIDVEFSRWNTPGNAIGQFVCQPYDTPGNIDRWDQTWNGAEVTSHAFRWLPTRVEYRSWRGNACNESAGTRTHTWTYSGQQLPRPEEPRVHMNLWQFAGAPSTTQEVVIDSFTFVPNGSTISCVTAAGEPELRPGAGGLRAETMLVRGGVTLHFSAARQAAAEVGVYTLGGRLVRSLLREQVGAGEHAVRWDGRDTRGDAVAAGVYVCRLAYAGDATSASTRVVVVR